MSQSTPLSNRASSWDALPTAALHGKIIAMQKAGQHIIDLTIGISNLPLPTSGQDAAIKAITDNQIPYTAIGGMTELKQAIQQKLSQQNHITATTANIIVTTGAKQAIFQILYTLTNPGDGVILFQPGWPAYTQIASMLQLNPQFIDVGQIAKLESAAVNPKSKFIIIDNPYNPTGTLFTADQLRSVLAFAKKHNLYILDDQGYEKLVYDGTSPCMASLDPDWADRIISVFSVSQSFSMMGWRLGYAVANPSIIQAMEAVQSAITAGASAVTQTAAAAILNSSSEYENNLVQEFKHRRDTIHPLLANIPQLSCQLPDGGPYFWIDIRSLTDNSLDFCAKLLEDKEVAFMPGEAFGAPGWMRMAFNIEPIEVLQHAVSQLADFIDHWPAK